MRTRLLLFLVLSILGLNAQKKQPEYVQIKNADQIIYNENLYGRGIQFLKGNVLLEHQGVSISCDSAFFNSGSNSFDAYGNVHASQGDSIEMFSEVMFYNGETSVLKAQNKVKLFENQFELYTDTAYFYRNSSLVTYPKQGITRDSINEIESLIGEYWIQTKTFHFKKNVVATNPDIVAYTDFLTYKTDEKQLLLRDRSKIVSKESVSFVDKGTHDGIAQTSSFYGSIQHFYDNYHITADSAFVIHEPEEIAHYYHHIHLLDTTQDLHIFADTMDLFKEKDSFLIYGTPTVQKDFEKDSLFLHADTIQGFTLIDSTRQLNFYPDVKFFKPDLKGKAKLMYFSEKTNLLTLEKDPIIWPETYQITGKQIQVLFNLDSSRVDSFYVHQEVFMVSPDLDSLNFNQLKGRKLEGYIDTIGKVDHVNIKGNAEIMYFIRNKIEEMVGVYKVTSSKIFVEFLKSKMKRYRVDQSPQGNMSPIEEVAPNMRQLSGLKWRIEEMPKTKKDIYIWEEKNDNPKQKNRYEKSFPPEL